MLSEAPLALSGEESGHDPHLIQSQQNGTHIFLQFPNILSSVFFQHFLKTLSVCTLLDIPDDTTTMSYCGA